MSEQFYQFNLESACERLRSAMCNKTACERYEHRNSIYEYAWNDLRERAIQKQYKAVRGAI